MASSFITLCASLLHWLCLWVCLSIIQPAYDNRNGNVPYLSLALALGSWCVVGTPMSAHWRVTELLMPKHREWVCEKVFSGSAVTSQPPSIVPLGFLSRKGLGILLQWSSWKEQRTNLELDITEKPSLVHIKEWLGREQAWWRYWGTTSPNIKATFPSLSCTPYNITLLTPGKCPEG